MVDLAWRWQITPEHLSRLLAKKEVPAHWVDAVHGLPRLSRTERARIERLRILEADAKKPIKAAALPVAKVDIGFENMDETLSVGDVVLFVQDAWGIPEGVEGVVEAIKYVEGVAEYKIHAQDNVIYLDGNSIFDFVVETGKFIQQEQ